MFTFQKHSPNLDFYEFYAKKKLVEFNFGSHPSTNRPTLCTAQIAVKITLKRYNLLHISNHDSKNVFIDFNGGEVITSALYTYFGSPCEPPVLADVFEVLLSPSRKMQG
jgi:hypothetical protein